MLLCATLKRWERVEDEHVYFVYEIAGMENVIASEILARRVGGCCISGQFNQVVLITNIIPIMTVLWNVGLVG